VRFLVEARAAATDAAGGVDVSEVQHTGSAAEVIGRESAAGLQPV
jgi:hypothetical protein